MSLLIIPKMLQEWDDGDYDLAICDGLQMITAISTLFMKNFTGDTLVATEDGNRRIDEIEVGDYVWAENVETGEKELRYLFFCIRNYLDTE